MTIPATDPRHPGRHARGARLRALARACSVPALVVIAGFIAAGCDGTARADEGGLVIHIGAGRDQTGTFPAIFAECGRQLGFRIEQVVMPPTADGQHEQYSRRLAGKDPTLDVLGLDGPWTAEFSQAGWVLDLSARMSPHAHEYVPSALATATYRGKIWAVPSNTNIAMLYFRKDLVDRPPTTWQELARTAAAAHQHDPDMAGFVWQGSQYEGFTVVLLELIHSAGGQALDSEGKVTLESPESIAAYTYLQQLFKTGATPQQVSTFQEEEARMMFQQGHAVFMRNWPYAWALSNQPESPVRGKVGVVGLPRFEGGETASVLGGLNFGISAYSHHPNEAFAAARCATSLEAQKRLFMAKNELPTLESLYVDPEVLRRSPFMSSLRASMDTAVSRPVTPYYNDVTVALSKYAHAVITGSSTPKQAVSRTHRALELAVQGEAEI